MMLSALPPPLLPLLLLLLLVVVVVRIPATSGFVCNEGDVNTICVVNQTIEITNCSSPFVLTGTGSIHFLSDVAITCAPPSSSTLCSVDLSFDVEILLTNSRIQCGIVRLTSTKVSLDGIESSIITTGQGYPSSSGPGAGVNSAGGSHAGRGGVGSAAASAAMSYGNAAASSCSLPGSGGAGSLGGGAGGGAIIITASELVLSNGGGSLLADGADAALINSGAGAGGCIALLVSQNFLVNDGGAQSIVWSAQGGNSFAFNTDTGGGGGGGRIHLSLPSTSPLPSSISVSARGGNGGAGTSPSFTRTTGGAGSIFFSSLSSLLITNRGVSRPTLSAVSDWPADGSDNNFRIQRLALGGGAVLQVGSSTDTAVMANVVIYEINGTGTLLSSGAGLALQLLLPGGAAMNITNSARIIGGRATYINGTSSFSSASNSLSVSVGGVLGSSSTGLFISGRIDQFLCNSAAQLQGSAISISTFSLPASSASFPLVNLTSSCACTSYVGGISITTTDQSLSFSRNAFLTAFSDSLLIQHLLSAPTSVPTYFATFTGPISLAVSSGSSSRVLLTSDATLSLSSTSVDPITITSTGRCEISSRGRDFSATIGGRFSCPSEIAIRSYYAGAALPTAVVTLTSTFDGLSTQSFYLANIQALTLNGRLTVSNPSIQPAFSILNTTTISVAQGASFSATTSDIDFRTIGTIGLITINGNISSQSGRINFATDTLDVGAFSSLTAGGSITFTLSLLRRNSVLRGRITTTGATANITLRNGGRCSLGEATIRSAAAFVAQGMTVLDTSISTSSLGSVTAAQGIFIEVDSGLFLPSPQYLLLASAGGITLSSFRSDDYNNNQIGAGINCRFGRFTLAVSNGAIYASVQAAAVAISVGDYLNITGGSIVSFGDLSDGGNICTFELSTTLNLRKTLQIQNAAISCRGAAGFTFAIVGSGGAIDGSLLLSSNVSLSSSTGLSIAGDAGRVPLQALVGAACVIVASNGDLVVSAGTLQIDRTATITLTRGMIVSTQTQSLLSGLISASTIRVTAITGELRLNDGFSVTASSAVAFSASSGVISFTNCIVRGSNITTQAQMIVFTDSSFTASLNSITFASTNLIQASTSRLSAPGEIDIQAASSTTLSTVTAAGRIVTVDSATTALLSGSTNITCQSFCSITSITGGVIIQNDVIVTSSTLLNIAAGSQTQNSTILGRLSASSLSVVGAADLIVGFRQTQPFVNVLISRSFALATTGISLTLQGDISATNGITLQYETFRITTPIFLQSAFFVLTTTSENGVNTFTGLRYKSLASVRETVFNRNNVTINVRNNAVLDNCVLEAPSILLTARNVTLSATVIIAQTVNITAVGNVIVQQLSSINADNVAAVTRGSPDPSASSNPGASHAGYGGCCGGCALAENSFYNSPRYPFTVAQGSLGGGNNQSVFAGYGGGQLYVNAGAFTCSGSTLSVRGGDAVAGSGHGGGSGGTIYVRSSSQITGVAESPCRFIISGGGGASPNGGGGSGGRLHLHAERNVDEVTVVVVAEGGVSNCSSSSSSSRGAAGTYFITEGSLIQSLLVIGSVANQGVNSRAADTPLTGDTLRNSRDTLVLQLTSLQISAATVLLGNSSADIFALSATSCVLASSGVLRSNTPLLTIVVDTLEMSLNSIMTMQNIELRSGVIEIDPTSLFEARGVANITVSDFSAGLDGDINIFGQLLVRNELYLSSRTLTIGSLGVCSALLANIASETATLEGILSATSLLCVEIAPSSPPRASDASPSLTIKARDVTTFLNSIMRGAWISLETSRSCNLAGLVSTTGYGCPSDGGKGAGQSVSGISGGGGAHAGAGGNGTSASSSSISFGGVAYNSNGSSVYSGSGGGSEFSLGGTGGGIIQIVAETLTMATGSLLISSGESGGRYNSEETGGAGAGAGGYISIAADRIDGDGLIVAEGGVGALPLGGGGGGGVVSIVVESIIKSPQVSIRGGSGGGGSASASASTNDGLAGVLLSLCPRGFGRVINADGQISVCEPCEQGQSSSATEPNVCLDCDEYGENLRPSNQNFYYTSTSSCHDVLPDDCVCEYVCLDGYFDDYQCRSAFDLAFELWGEFIIFEVYAGLFFCYCCAAIYKYRRIFQSHLLRKNRSRLNPGDSDAGRSESKPTTGLDRDDDEDEFDKPHDEDSSIRSPLQSSSISPSPSSSSAAAAATAAASGGMTSSSSSQPPSKSSSYFSFLSMASLSSALASWIVGSCGVEEDTFGRSGGEDGAGSSGRRRRPDSRVGDNFDSSPAGFSRNGSGGGGGGGGGGGVGVGVAGGDGQFITSFNTYQDTIRFSDDDIDNHICRIYLTGSNNPSSPWRLDPHQPPPILMPLCHIDEYESFATNLNQLCRTRRFEWIIFQLSHINPFFFHVHYRIRALRAHALKLFVNLQYDGGFLRRAKGVSATKQFLAFQSCPDLSLGFIDVIDFNHVLSQQFQHLQVAQQQQFALQLQQQQQQQQQLLLLPQQQQQQQQQIGYNKFISSPQLSAPLALEATTIQVISPRLGMRGGGGGSQQQQGMQSLLSSPALTSSDSSFSPHWRKGAQLSSSSGNNKVAISKSVLLSMESNGGSSLLSLTSSSSSSSNGNSSSFKNQSGFVALDANSSNSNAVATGFQLPFCIVFGGDGSYPSPLSVDMHDPLMRFFNVVANDYYSMKIANSTSDPASLLHRTTRSNLLASIDDDDLKHAIETMNFMQGLNAHLRVVNTAQLTKTLDSLLNFIVGYNQCLLEPRGLRCSLAGFLPNPSTGVATRLGIALYEYESVESSGGTEENFTPQLSHGGVAIFSSVDEIVAKMTEQNKQAWELPYALASFLLPVYNSTRYSLKPFCVVIAAFMLWLDIAVSILLVSMTIYADLGLFLLILLIPPFTVVLSSLLGLHDLYSAKKVAIRRHIMWNYLSIINAVTALACWIFMFYDNKLETWLWVLLPVMWLVLKVVISQAMAVVLANLEVSDLSAYQIADLFTTTKRSTVGKSMLYR